MPRTRYPLPSIAELTSIVLNGWYIDHDDAEESKATSEDATQDVRLHVFGSDRSPYGYRDCWVVKIGSPDYDHAHGDAIGATSYDFTERPTRKAAERIARDLIEQVRDQIADRRSPANVR